MTSTIGYHVVKSCYGLWLPGDERGSWSERWDEQLGYIEPHMLHDGDPIRLRMAEERMKHPPLRLSEEMASVVADAIANCVARSAGGLSIAAATIEPSHMHLLIPYTGRDIDITMKWIADQTTKAIHRQTNREGPLWCRGKWCSYIFDLKYWRNVQSYIRRHNERAGRTADPYSFIAAVEL